MPSTPGSHIMIVPSTPEPETKNDSIFDDVTKSPSLQVILEAQPLYHEFVFPFLIRIMKRKRNSGFCRVFTVAFLLFLLRGALILRNLIPKLAGQTLT